MTLDTTKPSDQELVSALPAYIRASRAAINAFESGEAEYTTTVLNLSTGTTDLVIGVDLASVDMEIVLISALGACALERITGGTAGQVKVFVMQDNDISFVDGVKAEGKFYLNHLPALSTYSALQDDSIALVNVGGDGGASSGYWKEFNRQISVK